MPTETYQHAEAFCLMRYQSDESKDDVEFIWNSRDGVTPFMVTLKSGHLGRHVSWHGDERLPDFKPQPGQRIWIDLTHEAADALARERADHFWDEQHPMWAQTTRRFASKDELVAVLAVGLLDEVERGAPQLLEVTQEYAHERGWLRTDRDKAMTGLAGVDRDLRRDQYGYELSENKLGQIADWALAQDLGRPMSELADEFIVEMLSGDSLPHLASGIEQMATDQQVITILEAIKLALEGEV